MFNFKLFIKNIKEKFLSSLYPENIKCIFCNDELFEDNEFITCDSCHNTLPFVNGRTCELCGKPINDETSICSNCIKRDLYFDKAFACFEYTGKVIGLVHNLKYNSSPYLSKAMANYMFYKLQSININIDFITYIPSHKDTLLRRGYNQAKLLANELSKKTLIPLIDVAVKTKKTKSQAKLKRSKRLTNLLGAFEKVENLNVVGKNILIIDDVLTTASTVNEISKILKREKANKIYVLTFATTPLKPFKKKYLKEKRLKKQKNHI